MQQKLHGGMQLKEVGVDTLRMFPYICIYRSLTHMTKVFKTVIFHQCPLSATTPSSQLLASVTSPQGWQPQDCPSDGSGSESRPYDRAYGWSSTDLPRNVAMTRSTRSWALAEVCIIMLP